MKKYFSIFCALFGSAAVMAGSLYKDVAVELEPEGTFYCISDQTGSLKLLHEYGNELTQALMQSELPREIRFRYAGIVNAVLLGIDFAGLEGDLAFGASSVEINPNPAAPVRFRNVAFLCRGEKPANGLIWKLFGNRNRDLAPDLGAVPADALLAMDFELHPVAATDAANLLMAGASGKTGATATAPLGDEVKKVLANVSGECAVLLLPTPETAKAGGLPVGVMLAMTDRDGSAFRGIAAMLGADPAKQEIVLPELPGQDFNIKGARILSDGKGTMTFYSGEEVIRRFADANAPRLKDAPDFKALTDKLPMQGVGFCYISPELGKLITAMSARFMKFPLPVHMPSQLTVLGCTPRGMKLVSNGSWDYNIANLNASLLPFLATFSGTVVSRMQEAQQAIQQKADRELCLANCRKLADGLQRYKAKNGSFPKKLDCDGMRELVTGKYIAVESLLCPAANGDEPAPSPEEITDDNISYIYFGNPPKDGSAKYPLIVDWPTNHANEFNVVFADGTTGTYQVEDLNNCRRLVSFLHSQFHYSEQEFKTLLKLADQLDRDSNGD